MASKIYDASPPGIAVVPLMQEKQIPNPYQRAPRFNYWLAFFMFSLIVTGASIEAVRFVLLRFGLPVVALCRLHDSPLTNTFLYIHRLIGSSTRNEAFGSKNGLSPVPCSRSFLASLLSFSTSPPLAVYCLSGPKLKGSLPSS